MSVDKSGPTVPPRDHPRRTPGSLAVKIVGVAVILAMIVATTAVALWRHRAEMSDAVHELRTLDLLLAEEAARSLQGVNLVLDNVADQVIADGVRSPQAFEEQEASVAAHEMLRVRTAGFPQLDAVTLISVSGKLINFSRSFPIPPVDLSDRDYFRYLKEHRTDHPFLSEPVYNRGSGTPTIYLARRIETQDGTLVGLVLGAIELDYFERFYASLHLDKDNIITLWRNDGALLARYPAAKIQQRLPVETISAPDGTWFGVPGVFERSWKVGGGAYTWIVASQPTLGFPMLVNLARAERAVLADWRREVLSIGAAVAFAVLCVVFLVWALLRRFQSYETVAQAQRERECANLARQEAEDALRQAQKMEAIGQLTGGVAHDFNNLLTVVRSSTELLRRPKLTDERRTRYVDAIAEACDRAAKLTAQLLAFARRQALKPELFDAAEHVAGTADFVRRLTGPHVRVRTVLGSGPCFIEADPNQLDTAIVNMAVNSRDAMDGDGVVTLSVQIADGMPSIRSQAAVEGRFVAISVSDTGRGITPETMERVFEPFFTTKKMGEGTGLGLSQVFGFAKQSGGDVEVRSQPGHETVFTLYLPQAKAPATVKTVVPKHLSHVATGQGARVLVVDDNEQVAKSTIQVLAELGFETVWSGDAEQALAELESGQERIDIVFSDVVMPGMDGIELGRRILERHPGMPIVLASGYSHVLAEKGSCDFPVLQKPYSMEELGRALREAQGQEAIVSA